MKIRAERAGDQQAVHRLTEDAFGQPDEARLIGMLRADGDVALSLVAEEGGVLLGHVLFSPMAAPVRVLGLAPLSVAPHCQKQGIGALLVRKGLELARDTGWQAVFVLGDPGYYARFGFTSKAAEGFENPFAGPHFMALELHQGALSTPFAVGYAPAFARL
ncbi:GNAT family N-acetyltransferase [Candidatus Halocynthiibacter alkanivorans]|uniref:GNAT family N-acetyltransferase n=1 Tax=Candidatus Halocynthiibacter alkanivorans TaxID=2267619 RepID=UPI000DF172AE|nr:N-acetyltransferase [Candidatus Halocynthiibacter alkanivorans]